MVIQFLLILPEYMHMYMYMQEDSSHSPITTHSFHMHVCFATQYGDLTTSLPIVKVNWQLGDVTE